MPCSAHRDLLMVMPTGKAAREGAQAAAEMPHPHGSKDALLADLAGGSPRRAGVTRGRPRPAPRPQRLAQTGYRHQAARGHGHGDRAVRPAPRERGAASPGAPGQRTMFHQAVRRRHEDAFVAVLPPDEIRRRSALPVNLDDHALAILIAHVAAPHNDLIAHFSAHPDHLPHRLDSLAVPSIGAAVRSCQGRRSPVSVTFSSPRLTNPADRLIELRQCPRRRSDAARRPGVPHSACLRWVTSRSAAICRHWLAFTGQHQLRLCCPATTGSRMGHR